MPSTEDLRRRAGNVSDQDLIRCAVELGWRYVGVGGGGHHKLVKEGRRSMAIPNHRRLRRRTVLIVLAELDRDAPGQAEPR